MRFDNSQIKRKRWIPRSNSWNSCLWNSCYEI